MKNSTQRGNLVFGEVDDGICDTKPFCVLTFETKLKAKRPFKKTIERQFKEKENCLMNNILDLSRVGRLRRIV